MRNFRRFTSLLLSFLMFFTALPFSTTTVSAEESLNEIKFDLYSIRNNTSVSDDAISSITITDEGYYYNGNSEELVQYTGGYTFFTSKNVDGGVINQYGNPYASPRIIIDTNSNINITLSDIYVWNAIRSTTYFDVINGTATFEIDGTNQISGNNDGVAAGVFGSSTGNGTLIFQDANNDGGTLTVRGSSCYHNGRMGITGGTVVVNSGTINAYGGAGGNSFGIFVDNLTINGGTVNITGGNSETNRIFIADTFTIGENASFALNSDATLKLGYDTLSTDTNIDSEVSKYTLTTDTSTKAKLIVNGTFKDYGTLIIDSESALTNKGTTYVAKMPQYADGSETASSLKETSDSNGGLLYYALTTKNCTATAENGVSLDGYFFVKPEDTISLASSSFTGSFTYNVYGEKAKTVIGENDGTATVVMPNWVTTIKAYGFRADLTMSDFTYLEADKNPSIKVIDSANNEITPNNTIYYYYNTSAPDTVSTWTTDTSQTLNAGDYKMYAVVSVSGYDDYTTEEVPFKVNKIQVPVPALQSVTYDGEWHCADVKGTDLYTLEDTSGGTNAGAYDVVLKLKDAVNDEWNTDAISDKDLEAGYVVTGEDGTVTMKFRITKATATLEASTQFENNEVTFGDKSFALTVSSNSASGEKLAQNLTYTSSNKNVVEVSDAGVVTIVGGGKADVTVNLAETDNYTSASKEICITVLQSEGNITVKNAKATVTYGDEFSMDKLYSFAETPESFEFSSSNDNVITFDKNGNAQLVGVGKATVTLSAGETKDYKTCSATFEITVEPADIEKSCDITVDVPEGGCTYDGTEKKPEVVVSLSGRTLTENTDYTVSYSDNKNVGTAATVTITGKGNLTGSITKTFTIVQAANEWSTSPSIKGWTYGEDASEPTYVAKYGNGTVKISYKPADAMDTVADVTSANDANSTSGSGNEEYTDGLPTDAGDYIVRFTVAETNNYAGLDTMVSLKIEQAEPKLSVKETTINATYGDTGVSIKPTYVGGGEITYTISDEDKKVATVDKNGNITTVGAGTATVTINLAATTNYKADSKEVTIKVAEAKIEDYDISLDLPEGGYIYDGTEKTPSVVVSFANSTLIEDTDYEVSYSDNKTVGTATVTITGKGNFTGTATKKFAISKTANEWVTKPSIESWTYGDEANTPTFDAKFGNTTAKVEYKKNDVETSALSDEANADGYTTEVPTDAGNYTVRVTIPATSDYGELVSDGVDFTIAQKDINGATVNLGNELTYTGKAQTQSITGVSVGEQDVTTYDVSGDTQTNAGKYTLTVTGTGNFKGSVTEKFIIKKAAEAPDAPAVELTPVHTVKTVEKVELSDNWQWSEDDINTELTDNKAVTATANYIGKDVGNYETESVVITITRQPCEHKGGTATCTELAVCTTCKEPYGDIDKTNHTGIVENVGAKHATCTEDGYTGDTKCTDCETTIEKGKTIAATGHKGETATCAKKAVCEICGEEYGELDLTTHTGGTATCVSGAVCEICGTEYTEKKAENHTGKTEVVNQKAATCTEKGYTGDTVCADCKTVLKNGTENSATGHKGGTATCAKKAVCEICGEEYGEIDLTTHTGGTATCTTKAICTICGKEYGELLDHSYTSEVTKESSDTEEGIRTYTCENCGYSYTKSIPKVEPPYIEGEDGKHGWDVIRSKTDEVIEEALANPDEDNTVNVVMNGAVTVPGDIFEKVKGQDVTVVFDMGDGIKWSVDGSSVSSDNIDTINLKVHTDEEQIDIPEDIMTEVINNAVDVKYTKKISLEHDGPFGFTAVMSIGLEKEDAGCYANLFYYNKDANKMEFMSSGRIAEDGTANLEFVHASDYMIVIDSESLAPEEEPTMPVEEPSTEPTTPAEEPSTELTTTETPTTAAPTTTQAPTTLSTTETTAAPIVVTPSTATPTTEAAVESPKTGDEANAPLAVLLMLISEISVAVCVMRRRKKN